MVLVFTYRFERRLGMFRGVCRIRMEIQYRAELSVAGVLTHSDASGHFELIIPGDSWRRKWVCRPLRMDTKRKHTRWFPTPTSSRLLFQLLRNEPCTPAHSSSLDGGCGVQNPSGRSGSRCGFVKNELGGPPMGNIEVSALVGNTNNTDANGKFTFSFPNKRPGDTVRLIVRKEGYVVVNDIQLELTLPTILRRGR